MGSGPLLQQGAEDLVCFAQISLAQGEAHVAAEGLACSVGALGLDDGIEADAGIGQGPAHRCCGAGAIGESAHTHLGLIQIQGHTADGRISQVAAGGVAIQLLLRQLKHLGGSPQGLGALMARHQATHLHFAGGDQAQVDASLRQGVEEFGGHPWPAQDAGS